MVAPLVRPRRKVAEKRVLILKVSPTLPRRTAVVDSTATNIAVVDSTATYIQTIELA